MEDPDPLSQTAKLMLSLSASPFLPVDSTTSLRAEQNCSQSHELSTRHLADRLPTQRCDRLCTVSAHPLPLVITLQLSPSLRHRSRQCRAISPAGCPSELPVPRSRNARCTQNACIGSMHHCRSRYDFKADGRRHRRLISSLLCCYTALRYFCISGAQAHRTNAPSFLPDSRPKCFYSSRLSTGSILNDKSEAGIYASHNLDANKSTYLNHTSSPLLPLSLDSPLPLQPPLPLSTPPTFPSPVVDI